MDSTKNISFDLKIKSVYIPENRKKNQKNKSMDYLNWMAYTINSVHYCKDKSLDIGINIVNNSI